ncbi:hypothetical protein CEP52_009560 [Fusarium oligoseptatum]|uniref:Uncharacterized protein n=1 Tax=Fusarium oligoseptatum TaxID=2604345 RepID=A0A428TCH6_9HYPO|nr:hypothetical protein CEP52_009560 [Fusarium oligoseptatum]
MASSRIISRFPRLCLPFIQFASNFRPGIPGPYNTAEHHILQHPTNPVAETKYTTASDKEWARGYMPISNIIVHSFVADDGLTHANFDDAFMPLDADDALRMSELAVPTNYRHWRLEFEADGENWFNTEVANVTLAAWRSYPIVVSRKNVDSIFSAKFSGERAPLVIGEMKRNLISAAAWQSGNILGQGSQVKLSQELRGYACKYECPQVFCFDGSTLLILQFRALRAKDLEDERCWVDCWVLPRATSSCTLRYALYRLLAQGWRRYQAEFSTPSFTIGGLTPCSREFFTGRPIWEGEGGCFPTHPGGYQRSVDAATRALMWTHEESPTKMETGSFW